jgi:glyceraldehyde 3-phosphate dehydrogenase
MAVKVDINGFGRIGPPVYRAMLERPGEFDVVAVNDLTDPKHLAMLLKYDSVHGGLGKPVEAGEGQLVVDGKPLKVLKEREPSKLPWKQLGVEVAVESTGIFTDREGPKGGFADHLKPDGSITDLTVEVEQKVTPEQVTQGFREAAGGPSRASCSTPRIRSSPPT